MSSLIPSISIIRCSLTVGIRFQSSFFIAQTVRLRLAWRARRGDCMTMPNQSAAANRRPAGQSDGSGNLSAIVAADRAFPAAVAELDR
jgi:hypothetical protein